ATASSSPRPRESAGVSRFAAVHGPLTGGRGQRAERQYACSAPYRACAAVKPSQINWSIRPCKEKELYSRADSADFTACSDQSTSSESTACAASSALSPAYSSCSMSPCREKAL